jgi:hypothetical protein
MAEKAKLWISKTKDRIRAIFFRIPNDTPVALKFCGAILNGHLNRGVRIISQDFDKIIQCP